MHGMGSAHAQEIYNTKTTCPSSIRIQHQHTALPCVELLADIEGGNIHHELLCWFTDGTVLCYRDREEVSGTSPYMHTEDVDASVT